MKKFLCTLLLSLFVLLPQASAETLADVSPDELYQRVLHINGSLDENLRLTVSDMVQEKSADNYRFDISKDDAVARVVLESNKEGVIERTNCVGSVATEASMEILYRTTAMVMQAVGLTAEEWNTLMDSNNQVRDETSFSSTVLASELNKQVVLLTMTVGNGIVGTSLSAK